MKSRRQTANIEGSNNFAGVSYLPNFYDDNLDIVEFDVVGVTNPKALSYYNFELVNFSKIDDKIIYEIDVTSKRKLQPLFEGTIFVQDIDYSMIAVRLKPNDVIVFPLLYKSLICIMNSNLAILEGNSGCLLTSD